MDKRDQLENVDLIFFDVETTGLDPTKGDTICEIGAVKFRDDTQIDTFHSLVNPKRKIPLEASRVHHIYDDDVKDAPSFDAIVDTFLPFLDNAFLCGYNISFDLAFLESELQKLNYPPVSLPSLDILSMARHTIPDLIRYNLPYIARYFNITNDTYHRALEDACITSKIFFKLRELLAQKGIVKRSDLLLLYGFNNDYLKRFQEPIIALLHKSIMQDSEIEMHYVSSDTIRHTFTIKPKRLSEENGLYLYGACGVSRQELRFNVQRILSLEIV